MTDLPEKSLQYNSRAVYWVPGNKERKDKLIFYGGHPDGDIHVYEIKESIPFNEAKKELLNILNAPPTRELNENFAISSWIEHKYGSSVMYSIR